MKKRLVHGLVRVMEFQIFTHNADTDSAGAFFELFHHGIPRIKPGMAAFHSHFLQHDLIHFLIEKYQGYFVNGGINIGRSEYCVGIDIGKQGYFPAHGFVHHCRSAAD